MMSIVHLGIPSDSKFAHEQSGKDGEEVANIQCHNRQHAIQTLAPSCGRWQSRYLQQVSNASLDHKQT